MDLYSINSGQLEPISSEPFKLEQEIQQLVESNLQSLFDLEFVASEYSIGSFRLDTLAYDPANKSFVIIEYKKGSSYSVVDQGYSYLSVMLNNKAEFILDYNERMTDSLKKKDVDWSSTRVIFISPSFNAYQRNSVNFKDVPFELYEIKRYEGGIIGLESISASSKESISSLSPIGSKSTISEVSSEVKVHELDEHLSKLSASTLPLWQALLDQIEEYGDIDLHATASYVAVKRGSKTVSFVHFRKSYLNLEFLRGNLKSDGSTSKGFFNADDPKQLLNERSWTWKSGDKGSVYQVDFKAPNQLEDIMNIFDQKYKSFD
ncbi:DUF5655 domain-containing protein [uncultured Umboniibacter sp.]|uniref:DUF5655 domain-containing protein n=1 Tax=uncultured Umboniibacter sp. TaxID=1798917 RepID=UPI00260735ED|nr:DUF5655 domain-containing protein [uncultured Umboniibacter sp.]